MAISRNWFSENPSLRWRRGRRAVARKSKHILTFVITLYLLLLHTTIVYFLASIFCVVIDLFLFRIICHKLIVITYSPPSRWFTWSFRGGDVLGRRSDLRNGWVVLGKVHCWHVLSSVSSVLDEVRHVLRSRCRSKSVHYNTI